MAQLSSRQRFNLMRFFYCSFRKSRNTCQSWAPSLTICPGRTIRCVTVTALKLQTGVLHLQLEASGSCRKCLTDLTPTLLQFYLKKKSSFCFRIYSGPSSNNYSHGPCGLFITLINEMHPVACGNVPGKEIRLAR